MSSIPVRDAAGSVAATPLDHRLPPAAPGHNGAAAEPGLADLFRDLADDTRRLIKDEVALARTEARGAVRRVGKDAGRVAIGAGVAIAGGLCLVVGLALGLGALLGSYWVGAVITGVVLSAAGALVAFKGVKDFRDGALRPEATISTVKADAAWAREEARDFKRELAADLRASRNGSTNRGDHG